MKAEREEESGTDENRNLHGEERILTYKFMREEILIDEYRNTVSNSPTIGLEDIIDKLHPIL